MSVSISPCRAAGGVGSKAVLRPEIAISICDQLAMLLDAQVPLDQALVQVMQELEDERAREMLASIHRSMCANGRVAEAFGRFPKQFPTPVQQLLRVGHETARLGASFRDLGRHWTEVEEMRAIARKAATYPAIAATITCGIALFLMLGVLPLFERVYRELGVALPLLTRFYLGASAALRHHPFLLVVGFGCFGALALLVWKNERCRCSMDRCLLAIPGLSELIVSVAAARIAGLLATLERSGMAVQESVRLCQGCTGNRVLDGVLRQMSAALREGVALSDSFEQTDRFPAVVHACLRIGEQTNRLGEALERVREYSSRRSREMLQRALQWLEPALTVLLGLLVGSVAVSLFQPLVLLAMSIKR